MADIRPLEAGDPVARAFAGGDDVPPPALAAQLGRAPIVLYFLRAFT
ncbi:MAG: hypothetical protein WKG32_23900 [Gemmatimonadaceae bacterium]